MLTEGRRVRSTGKQWAGRGQLSGQTSENLRSGQREAKGGEEANAGRYDTPSWMAAQKCSFPPRVLSAALTERELVWQPWREEGE